MMFALCIAFFAFPLSLILRICRRLRLALALHSEHGNARNLYRVHLRVRRNAAAHSAACSPFAFLLLPTENPACCTAFVCWARMSAHMQRFGCLCAETRADGGAAEATWHVDADTARTLLDGVAPYGWTAEATLGHRAFIGVRIIGVTPVTPSIQTCSMSSIEAPA